MPSKLFFAACAAGGLLIGSFPSSWSLADEASQGERPVVESGKAEPREKDGQDRPERRRERTGPAEGRPPVDKPLGPDSPRQRMRPGAETREGIDMPQQLMQRMGEILERLERLERRMDPGPGMRDGRPPMQDNRREGPRPEWQGDRREGFRPEPRGPREGDGQRREGQPQEIPNRPQDRPWISEEMRGRMQERMQDGRGMMEQARQRMEEARERFEAMQRRIEELEAEVKQLRAAD
jgi:hypothetical protein